MTEQISKLLKDYLDELDDTMLREFKWYLGQHKERGSRPIQRSQLENTSRTETVDKLVQAYGAEGAVVTTVDVLYRMRLNDLATQLAQAIIDSDAEQREVGGAQPEAREQKPNEEQTLKAPKDLCCSICLSVFQTPVILQCGHSFCRTCVEKSWEGKVSRRCSLCDQLFTGAEPQVNFSLKNLSENYMESHSQPTPAPQRQSRTTKTKINLLTLLQDSESSVASRTSTSADRRSQICGKPSVQSLEEAAENHKEHFRRTSSVSKATTEQVPVL